jgi:hypothetical protein
MGMTVRFFAPGAPAAAAPALAQDANNTADANAAAPVATDANAVAPVAPDANAVAPVAEPAPVADDTVAPAPAPEKKGGFPWGVIGLLGLIGLIPRKGR